MSQSEEEQIRLKQELLKNEILNKEYDKDKFLQFCLMKKENGDDLSKWTFDELNEAKNAKHFEPVLKTALFIEPIKAGTFSKIKNFGLRFWTILIDSITRELRSIS